MNAEQKSLSKMLGTYFIAKNRLESIQERPFSILGKIVQILSNDSSLSITDVEEPVMIGGPIVAQCICGYNGEEMYVSIPAEIINVDDPITAAHAVYRERIEKEREEYTQKEKIRVAREIESLQKRLYELDSQR